MNRPLYKIKLNTLEDASKLVNICSKFEEDVDLLCGRYIISAKSILGVLSVDFGADKYLDIHTDNSRIRGSFEVSIKQFWEVEE